MQLAYRPSLRAGAGRWPGLRAAAPRHRRTARRRCRAGSNPARNGKPRRVRCSGPAPERPGSGADAGTCRPPARERPSVLLPSTITHRRGFVVTAGGQLRYLVAVMRGLQSAPSEAASSSPCGRPGGPSWSTMSGCTTSASPAMSPLGEDLLQGPARDRLDVPGQDPLLPAAAVDGKAFVADDACPNPFRDLPGPFWRPAARDSMVWWPSFLADQAGPGSVVTVGRRWPFPSATG
jgi:hypothetical protein